MSARAARYAPVTNELVGIEILLVDDDDDGRELCEVVLASRGAHVRSAATARAALDLLSGWRPSILVGDVSLPDENGYAFLARARALDADLPAIAVTGYAAPADVRRALDAGYQQHLAKPICLDELVGAVFRFARRGRASPPA
jgi:CheY-like chemotaxis protein